MPSRDEVLNKLARIVVEGRIDDAKPGAEEALSQGLSPLECINEGLSKGMKIVGEKFEAKEYFLPEMLLAAITMKSALEVILPKVPKSSAGRGTVVIGTVEGDIHDIAKTIVASFLTAAGFTVHDLGRDIPSDVFVKKAKELGAQVIAMSTLMTPTLESMKKVEEKLKKSGLKGKVKTIIGGGSVTPEFAQSIGADAYGKDASEAVSKVKMLIDSIKEVKEVA